MRILITGCAGFIGYHLTKSCLERGDIVVGIDNLNDYYDVNLKRDRLHQLMAYNNFDFRKEDISDLEIVKTIFSAMKPECVVNLAAQAGVRYSIENPHAYIQSNIVGFTNIIDACRLFEVKHLIYASSSSVYGGNGCNISHEGESTNHPFSIYAATKKSNELIAHSYSHLYQLPTTGLRFFTAYGPWGRPDMAFFTFTRNILAGKPIEVHNNGQMQRDFTYIDDIVHGLLLVIDKTATPDLNWSATSPCPASSYAPYRVYNIGSGQPLNLLDYIDEIEQALDKKAVKIMMPMRKEEVLSTHASTQLFQQAFGFSPRISLKEGMARFLDWYLEYFDQV